MPRIAIATDKPSSEPIPEFFASNMNQNSTPIPSIELSDKEKSSFDDFDEESFQSFIKFISENVDNLQKVAALRSDPTFMELNQALTQHQTINLSLIFLYEEIRFEETLAREKYEHSFNTFYIKTREKMCDASLPASKYPSTKEMEAITNTVYYTELKPLWNERKMLEHKLSALRRLIDSWDKFAFTLNSLSKNIQTEVNSHFVSGKAVDLT